MDEICEVFNLQAIPKLIDLNADHFKGITDYPKMEHTDVEKPDIATISSFLKDMVGVGILQPDEGIEDYVRDLGSLPDRVEGAPMPGVDDKTDDEEEEQTGTDNHHQETQNTGQNGGNASEEEVNGAEEKIDDRANQKVRVMNEK